MKYLNNKSFAFSIGGLFFGLLDNCVCRGPSGMIQLCVIAYPIAHSMGSVIIKSVITY